MVSTEATLQKWFKYLNVLMYEITIDWVATTEDSSFVYTENHITSL